MPCIMHGQTLKAFIEFSIDCTCIIPFNLFCMLSVINNKVQPACEVICNMLGICITATRSISVMKSSLHQTALRTFASIPHADQTKKLYELRRYTMKPDKLSDYNKLTKDLFHLRTRYSKLCGFWFSEIGTELSQTLHIWEYDSLSHRAEVRAALSKDEEWQNKFIPTLLSCVQKQENISMYMPDWCKDMKSTDKKNGIYELMTYTMVMGGPAIWDNKLQASVNAHVRLAYSDLIGVWYTDVGDHNTVQILWRYDTYDVRMEGRQRAHRDAVVVNKVRDNLHNVTHHCSILMSPSLCPWSPLQ